MKNLSFSSVRKIINESKIKNTPKNIEINNNINYLIKTQGEDNDN